MIELLREPEFPSDLVFSFSEASFGVRSEPSELSTPSSVSIFFLFFSGLSETLDATEEAGGKVKSEPMGTTTFLITSEVKYMIDDVRM